MSRMTESFTLVIFDLLRINFMNNGAITKFYALLLKSACNGAAE